MVRPSDIGGVVLDIDWEYSIEINLPLVESYNKIKYNNKIIEVSNHKYGEIMLLGDIHIGHTDQSFNPFNSYLQYLLKHPYIQIGLMGDYIECAETTNFVKEERIDTDAQITDFVRMMRPLKNRIRFMLWGNHEERLAKITKSNRFLQSIANEIGVNDHCYIARPQSGVNCWIKVDSKTYTMDAKHGMSGAIYNDFIQHKKTAMNTNATVIAQGHTHKLGYTQITEKSNEETGGQNGIVTRRRFLVNTGCFLKDPGYGGTRSYPLTNIGAPIVRFYASASKVEIEDLGQDYKDYLTKGGLAFGDFNYNLNHNAFWRNSGKPHSPLMDRLSCLPPSMSDVKIRECGKCLPPR